MPERSGGTTVSGTDVTGTRSIPMPTPAMGSTQPSVPNPTWGPSTALASRIPPPASRHPTTIGQRAPSRATKGPVSAEDEDQPGRHGQEVDGGLIRRGVHDDLKVQSREEEDGERSEVGDERDERRPGEGRTPEHGQVEHRALDPLLDYDERRSRQAADHEQGHDPRRLVARLLPLDHGERQTGEEGCPRRKPATSTLRPCAVGRLRHEQPRQREGDDAEAQVEPEDGTPAREPDQCAGDDRSERESQPRHCGPDAKGVRPRLAVGIDVPDDGERARLARRRADAHDHPAGDEPARRWVPSPRTRTRRRRCRRRRA